MMEFCCKPKVKFKIFHGYDYDYDHDNSADAELNEWLKSNPHVSIVDYKFSTVWNKNAKYVREAICVMYTEEEE